MKRSFRAVRFALTVVLTSTISAQADELRGAAALLKDIGTTPPVALVSPPAQKTPQEQWREDVSTFATDVAALEPDEAAAGWLDLLDRGIKLRTVGGQWDGTYPVGGFARLVGALPWPEQWPALAQAIEARPAPDGSMALRERALRMLAHLLRGAEAAAWDDLLELERLLPKLDEYRAQSTAQQLQQIGELLAMQSDDATRRLTFFEAKLRHLESVKNAEERHSLEFFGVDIPDLVVIGGEPKAEELLRRAVVLPLMIEIPEGDRTREIARRVALEQIDNLKRAQWKLCWDMDAAPLFEAMREKFLVAKTVEPAAGDGANLPGAIIGRLSADRGEDREDAAALGGVQHHYLMHLIATDRMDEARAFAREMREEENWLSYHMYGRHSRDYSSVAAILRTPHAAKALAFLREELTAHPESPMWLTYVRLAMTLGELDGVAEGLREAIKLVPPRDQRAYALREQLRQVLLSQGRVDVYAAILRERMNAGGAAPDPQQTSEAWQAMTALADLGAATSQPEWIDEALARFRALCESGVGQGDAQSTAGMAFARALRDQGRTAEAEAILAEALALAIKSGGDDDRFSRGGDVVKILIALVRLYDGADRPQDVLLLLDEAPFWGARDLAELDEVSSRSMPWGQDAADPGLELIVAKALAANDRRDDARRLANDLIRRSPGDDGGYEIIAELDGSDALPSFESRFQRDRFEERPLIWKAHVLRKAGRVDEAQAALDQAIAIDPSDGEQGPGRRMRAYAELAELRAAQGRTVDEEFLRNVVAAIRIGEDADRLMQGGLLTRGVERYREALAKFADAYCLQSRLAIRLASMGRPEEALAHFRRAYELMPDSFGRMESHCFGCEGVFTPPEAQEIAEEVFAKLAKDRPEDARVHYMLGYLREQQERYDDALAAFREAVRLDPDYYNAWSHIQGLRGSAIVPVALADEAAVNVYRLRPNEAQVTRRLAAMHDLRLLWNTVAKHPRAVESPPTTLYRLAAATAQLEKASEAAKAAGRSSASNRWSDNGMRELPQPKTPGEVLAQHQVVSALAELIVAGEGE